MGHEEKPQDSLGFSHLCGVLSRYAAPFSKFVLRAGHVTRRRFARDVMARWWKRLLNEWSISDLITTR